MKAEADSEWRAKSWNTITLARIICWGKSKTRYHKSGVWGSFFKCYISWIFWIFWKEVWKPEPTWCRPNCKTVTVWQKKKKQLSDNENKPQEENNRDKQDSRLGEWKAEKDEMITSRVGWEIQRAVILFRVQGLLKRNTNWRMVSFKYQVV